MKYIPKAFALATVLAATGTMSSAATTLFENDIFANQDYTFAQTLAPEESLEFRFTVLQDLTIQQFSLSGTGNNAGDDLEAIRFGLGFPLEGFFSTITAENDSSTGTAFMPGASYSMGDVFSVFFEDGIDSAVSVTLSFSTEVAAVPLPATALLLAPVLLAGGLFGRRRRQTAA